MILPPRASSFQHLFALVRYALLPQAGLFPRTQRLSSSPHRDYRHLFRRHSRHPVIAERRVPKPRSSHVLGFGLLSIIGITWLVTPFDSDANYHPSPDTTISHTEGLILPYQPPATLYTPPVYTSPEPASTDVVDTLPPTNPGQLKSFTVKKGDSLSSLFERAGLPLVQAIRLARHKEAKTFTRLQPGEKLHFYFDESARLDSLEYEIDEINTLIASVDPEGRFQIAKHVKEVEYRELTASGRIDSSLSMAAEKAGIPYSLALALVDIFKWEIDFATEVQPGDEFRMIYQRAYINGKFVRNGAILGAEFINGGRRIQAIRFEDSDGYVSYFTPDGESLRRGFLRTPVKLGRISSHFSSRRFHPIKKTWRAHKGVDYAAKRGTPILATGDGVVQFVGRKKGYGKTVILRHGDKYTTLYAHMSKSSSGVRSGKRVTQGQVIGYVGSTGLATGPHLHYEFRVNGRHKNPVQIKLPKAAPLEKKYLDQFSEMAKPLLARLDQMDTIRVAKN